MLLELAVDVADRLEDCRLEGPGVRVRDPSVDREDVQQVQVQLTPGPFAP